MKSTNEFFEALFGNCLNQNGGFIELRQFENQPHQLFFGSADEVVNNLTKFKMNGYFGVCLKGVEGGEKKDVSHVVALWADVDYGKEGHKHETKFDTYEQALNAINQFEFKPSITVHSGHGLQPYWLLDQPEAITDDSKLLKVEGIIKGISVAIGGDSVKDLSRVLRIPDTTNQKPDCSPKDVKVIKFDPSLKYALEDFSKFQCEVKPESKAPVDVTFSERIANVDVDSLDISQTQRELIKSGDTKGVYPSRSECDQAVIVALLSKNYSPDVIKTIFSDENNKIGEKYREERATKGDAYLQSSIKNALAYLKGKESVNHVDALPVFPMQAFPATGFLGDYVKYASGCTDSPVQFHVATALSVLAIILNRNMFIKRGHGRLFPVMWIVVLAESGAYRKSTSQAIGLDLLRTVNPHLVGSNEFTKEGLVGELSDSPRKLLCFSEVASLLIQAEATYNRGLKPILIDLFDSPDMYVRKLKDTTYAISEPLLNILGASTTEWFIANVKEEELRSGFLARFIYICAVKRGKPLAFPPLADLKLKKMLIKMLVSLSKKRGEVKLSTGAMKLYEEWYAQQDNKLAKESLKGILSPFYVRLSDYLLKIAMLFAVNDGTLIISTDHMKQAIVFTDYLVGTFRYYLKNEMSFSTFAKEKNKLKKMILDAGFEGINHSKLLQNSNKETGILSKYLTTLIESSEIYERLGPKGGKIYVSTQYRKGDGSA